MRLATALPSYRDLARETPRFTFVEERSQTALRVNLALQRTRPAARVSGTIKLQSGGRSAELGR